MSGRSDIFYDVNGDRSSKRLFFEADVVAKAAEPAAETSAAVPRSSFETMGGYDLRFEQQDRIPPVFKTAETARWRGTPPRRICSTTRAGIAAFFLVLVGFFLVLVYARPY